MVMESTYKKKDSKREQLKSDFAAVGTWAQTADAGKFSQSDLQQMATDAEALAALCNNPDPARAMRYAANLVMGMDRMIGLQKALKGLPAQDPDRTNERLRTALRRIQDIREKDVWHIQLT